MFFFIIEHCRGELSVELSCFEGREDLAIVVPASRWKKYSNHHQLSRFAGLPGRFIPSFTITFERLLVFSHILGSPAFSLVQLGFKLVPVGFILTLGKGGVFDHLSRFLFAFSHCLACIRVKGLGADGRYAVCTKPCCTTMIDKEWSDFGCCRGGFGSLLISVVHPQPVDSSRSAGAFLQPRRGRGSDLQLTGRNRVLKSFRSRA